MGTMATTTSLQTLMVGTDFNTATTSLAVACITQAENEIRKVLSKRYDVTSDYFQTTTSIPPMVTTLCEWLAVGYMHENLSRGGKESYVRADRYIEKAMENMKMILDYKSNLLDSAGSLIAEASGSFKIRSGTKDYAETFGEDDDLNWKISGDKLEDLSDDRDE